jgi:hypothetical protein
MKKLAVFTISIFLLFGTSLVFAGAGDSLLNSGEKKSWHSPSTRSGDSLMQNREMDYRHKQSGDSLKLNEPAYQPKPYNDPYNKSRQNPYR